MQEDHSPEARISKLIKETAPKLPRRTPTPKKAAAASATNVISLNEVRAGRDVNVNIGAIPAPKQVTTVQTGVGTINAKQKADLTKRLEDWLELRNSIRKKPMTIQAARFAMNKAMGVNSYHELKPEQLQDAMKWIRKQTGILMSMKSAPVQVDDFRQQAIGAIKARCRNLGDMHYYVPHLVKTYGVDSLTHLSDTQLQDVRSWIFQQRRGRR